MITFNTAIYEFSHGKKPRGYGSWAFSMYSDLHNPTFAPSSMSYRDAKAWYARQLQNQGFTGSRTVYVCS